MTGWDSLSWEAKRGAVLADAGFLCQICFEAEAVEVDHIWPRALGGMDHRANLRAACRPCNRSKGDRLWASDIDRFPHLARYGVRHAEVQACQAVHQAARWTIYAEAADSVGTQGVDAALAEDDSRFERIAGAVADLVATEVDRAGPMSAEHAAGGLIESVFAAVLERGDES